MDINVHSYKIRDGQKWTMAAEAKDYLETLAMERQMQEDPEFRKRWAESEAVYESRLPFDYEGDESMEEDEGIALAEKT